MPQNNHLTPADPGKTEYSLANAVMKRMLQVLLTYLVLAAILFLSSGDLAWVWAWAYLGVGLGIS